MGVGVGMPYFGLLQKKEVLKIHFKHLAWKSTRYRIYGVLQQKTATQDMDFYLPEYMNPLMKTYLSQIPKKQIPSSNT